MGDKNEIKEWINKGRELDASYLIVLLDTYDNMIFNKYVFKDQTIEKAMLEVYKYHKRENIKVLKKYSFIKNEEKEDTEIKNEKTMYEEALEFATKMHSGQVRTGNNSKPYPYIIHPITVSRYVDQYMGDDFELEKYKTVAILHDTIEDTDATYDDIKNKFGKKIADLVLSLTNNPEKEEKLGKDVYLSKKMLKLTDKLLTVKLCDRLDNVNSLKYMNKDFIDKYSHDTIYIMNYLLLYRDLNETHLKLINKILRVVCEVSKKPMLIEPRVLKNKK